MVVLSHGGYNIIKVGRPREWRLLGGNPRVAVPGALAPKTAPMGWA
jgi:hypothetical protein